MSALVFRVGPASVDDLGAILELERLAPGAPHWPESTYAAILQSERHCLMAAHVAEELVGFAVGVAPEGMNAELESIAVAQSARRRGVGRALCHAVLEWCRLRGAQNVTLEVRASNAGAIALYSGLEFLVEGRRPRYYTDPEDDAVLMRLAARSLAGTGIEA